MYFYFLLLLILLFDSCSVWSVGKSCKYQRFEGVALVKSNSKNQCVVNFYTKDNSLLKINNISNLDARCYGKVERNKKYFAVYNKTISFSGCKPFSIDVYSSKAKTVLFDKKSLK